MAKYINADEFVTKLDTMKNPDSEFATDDYIDGFSDGVSDAIKELMTMPSADVVEVVRCKDCDNFEDIICGWCRYFEKPITLNDYCSRGEKRDSETT